MYIFQKAVKTNIVTSQLYKRNEKNQYYDNEVTENLIKRMETLLQTPESELCVQDFKNERINNDKIFFIAKGKCEVKVKDRFEDRIEACSAGFLGPGSHFGEISMIFHCKRTASVYATNYITCASIDRLKFNELLTLYPTLNELLKKEVVKYKDPLKCFIEMRLN